MRDVPDDFTDIMEGKVQNPKGFLAPSARKSFSGNLFALEIRIYRKSAVNFEFIDFIGVASEDIFSLVCSGSSSVRQLYFT